MDLSRNKCDITSMSAYAKNERSSILRVLVRVKVLFQFCCAFRLPMDSEDFFFASFLGIFFREVTMHLCSVNELRSQLLISRNESLTNLPDTVKMSRFCSHLRLNIMKGYIFASDVQQSGASIFPSYTGFQRK